MCIYAQHGTRVHRRRVAPNTKRISVEKRESALTSTHVGPQHTRTHTHTHAHIPAWHVSSTSPSCGRAKICVTDFSSTYVCVCVGPVLYVDMRQSYTHSHPYWHTIPQNILTHSHLEQTHYDTKHVIYLQNAGCNISLALRQRLAAAAAGARRRECVAA